MAPSLVGSMFPWAQSGNVYRSVVFLTFADPTLERMYAEHTASGVAACDMNVGRVHLLIAVLATLLSPILPSKFWDPRLHALYSLVLAVYLMSIQYWHKRRAYLQWREAIAFVSRLVFCYIAAEANQDVNWWTDTSQGNQPYWKVLLFGSGAISNIWFCFALPMRLRYHLLSHGLSLLMYMKTTSPAICQPMLATPAAAALTDRLSSLALQATGAALAALGLPTTGLATCAGRTTCRCYLLLFSFNLLVALLPSLSALWLREWQARAAFVEQLHQQQESYGAGSSSSSSSMGAAAASGDANAGWVSCACSSCGRERNMLEQASKSSRARNPRSCSSSSMCQGES